MTGKQLLTYLQSLDEDDLSLDVMLSIDCGLNTSQFWPVISVRTNANGICLQDFKQ